MRFSAVKKTAQRLQNQAGFLIEISSEKDYEQALSLMDELVEDYDNQQLLIDLLSRSIEQWENASEEFGDFNRDIDRTDQALSALRLLMDQHGLGVDDLPEIGGKSYVSKILNERDRKLTRQHIEALCRRFRVSPTLFFDVA